MNRRASIPQSILSKAKRLNPFATIPNKPGKGVIISSYFMRNVNLDDLFYFGIAKAYDGRLYLVYHPIAKPFPDPLGNIVLRSPFLSVTWDQTGAIREWAAGQQKLGVSE
ncbi:hypothetical protein R9X47_03295 [Wukongibacter baidiensis]|uniref:hypothetical protein n=1 Tax=Wukongibacter baidiensis TaxID=1723361 RepID=UPI003D7FDD14